MNGGIALSIFGAVRGRDLAGAGRELAEKFDLDLRLKVLDMSRGMRQKLGLILALAHSPRLLVLDEPTSALDPLIQQVLHDLLRQLAAAGRTVFFSSHSLGEVDQLCHHVAIVRDGEIVADESLPALRNRAGHDVTIRWKEDASARPLEPPDFLKLTRREGLVWHGTLDGSVQRLVDGRPDLESLFRRFYERDQEGRR